MRILKCLFLILILLSPSVSLAEDVEVDWYPPPAAGGVACDASTSDVCEDWDPATLTWTDVTTGGTVAAAAHSGTLACTDKGSNAITVTYASQADLYSRADLGSAQAVIYGSLYFIITDRPNTVNGTYRAIFAAGGQTDGSSAGIRVTVREYSSEQLQVGVSYNSTTLLGSYVNINEDTWYRVSFFRSSDGDAGNANDTVTWWLDGTQQATITTADLVLVQHPRYITVSNRDEVAESIGTSFQVDNLELDYTAMPDACP